MEIHLQIIGWLLIGLALLHFVFPEYFKWKQELNLLSLINKQIMLVHSFFIALMVFLVGLLCVSSSNEMINTPFGKKICLGLGLFWMTRLFVQFFGYSSKLWKGKLFETTIHILSSILWTYLTAIFMLIYYSNY